MFSRQSYLLICLSAVLQLGSGQVGSATTSTVQQQKPTIVPMTPMLTTFSSCNGSDTDIVFVLDTSGSIGQQGFTMMMDFVKSFIDHLDISPTGNGVGIMTFSRYPIIRVPLAKYSDEQSLFDAVDAVPYVQGVTETNSALLLLAREAFANSDPYVPHVAIVVTDGRSRDQFATVSAANEAKGEGIVMFSVGIGADYDPSELNAIATAPEASHVFTVTAFNDLANIVQQLSTDVCGSQSNTTVTPAPATPAPAEVNQTTSTSDQCNGTKADIFVLLDTTVSLQYGSFSTLKQFVVDMVSLMDIGQDATLVGLITWSDYPSVRIPLGNHTDKLDLINAILKVPYYPGDKTQLDQGLELVRKEGFNNDRPDASNFVIVVTDGIIQDSGVAGNVVQDLINVGVIVYTIGVGQDISSSQLMSFSSGPDGSHYIFTNTFAGLSAEFSSLSSSICTEAQNYTLTSPTTISPTNVPTNTPPVTLPVSTTRKPTGTEACQGRSADVFFLVDSSGSVDETEYNMTKNFIVSLVGKFDVAQTLTRVGLITFSTEAVLEFGLGDYENASSIQGAVWNVKHYAGGTSTAKAIELLRTNGFQSDRPDVPNIAVVLTDGRSADPFSTKTQATLAKEANFTMIAVGIGGDYDLTELDNIASSDLSGNSSYAFHVKDYASLDSVSELIAYIACGFSVIIANPNTAAPSTSAHETTTATGVCGDTINNCHNYGMDICFDYEPWARAHCSGHCGFCEGGGSTTPGQCVDHLPNCHEYGADSCTSTKYAFWARTNCPKYCRVCGNGPSPTDTGVTVAPHSTPTTKCANTIEICHQYGANLCTAATYRAWASANCAEYCGFCSNYVDYHPSSSSCPDWHLPKACTLELTSADSCCPMPKCPTGYVLSAMSPNEIQN